MSRFLLLLALLASSLSFACPTVNLITEERSPFDQIPVYDQDGTGACYAYSASQLADFYLIRNAKSGRSVHPAWAALAHATATSKKQIRAGNTLKTIKALRDIGNCDYSKVEAALKKWVSYAGIQESELLSVIEEFSKNIDLQASGLNPKSFNLLNLSIVESLLTVDYEMAINSTLLGKNSCESSDFDALFKKLLKPLKDLDQATILKEILKNYCDEKSLLKLGIPEPTSLIPPRNITDKEVLSQLSFHLTFKKSPVSTSLCSNVFYDPKYVGLWKGPVPNRLASNKSGCASHEVLITGMKQDGNQCKFLIRNSWGPGFWTNVNLKCLCKNKKTNGFEDDCSPKTHSSKDWTVEGCWINDSSLIPNIFQMTVLEDSFWKKF